MSKNEVHRLIAQMQPELDATGYAVLRCGLCVLIVAGLAASSAATTSDAAKTSNQDDHVVARTVYAGRRALMESQRSYGERREQFQKRWSGCGSAVG